MSRTDSGTSIRLSKSVCSASLSSRVACNELTKISKLHQNVNTPLQRKSVFHTLPQPPRYPLQSPRDAAPHSLQSPMWRWSFKPAFCACVIPPDPQAISPEPSEKSQRCLSSTLRRPFRRNPHLRSTLRTLIRVPLQALASHFHHGHASAIGLRFQQAIEFRVNRLDDAAQIVERRW
jgi:hypothetical protein